MSDSSFNTWKATRGLFTGLILLSLRGEGDRGIVFFSQKKCICGLILQSYMGVVYSVPKQLQYQRSLIFDIIMMKKYEIWELLKCKRWSEHKSLETWPQYFCSIVLLNAHLPQKLFVKGTLFAKCNKVTCPFSLLLFPTNILLITNEDEHILWLLIFSSVLFWEIFIHCLTLLQKISYFAYRNTDIFPITIKYFFWSNFLLTLTMIFCHMTFFCLVKYVYLGL